MTRLLWPDYRMFAYERDLAFREVVALVGTRARGIAGGLEVPIDETALLGERITYAHSLAHEDKSTPTAQAAVETTHQRYRPTRATRQATRFLVHGLHEYKGKFNPQLARALVNVTDPEATALLDPFCGSGTTLVEGLRLGLNVAGIDRSPLAAWISRVKVATLIDRKPGKLREDFDTLRQRALKAIKQEQNNQGQNSGRASQTPPLDDVTRNYLAKWFPEGILAGLLGAVAACAEQQGTASDLVRLAISSIVRSVSWQLPEDLRIRRRPTNWIPPDVSVLFDEACRRIDTALAELTEHRPTAPGLSWSVHNGSCDDGETVGMAWPRGRRLIVTSPPYATALPYIDTDRLSIALLGLAPSASLGSLERALIGSREWNRGEANRWVQRREANTDRLPTGLRKLLTTIEKQNVEHNAGFRRRDVPALLYRYFASMGAAMSTWAAHMQPGQRAVLVIGRNRTGPKDHQITIDTPHLLADLASSRGFKPVELIPLQTWPRFGLHADNAVDAEEAVILEQQG